MITDARSRGGIACQSGHQGRVRRFITEDKVDVIIGSTTTPNAMAIQTLGKDMVFRDFSQGAYRMRGIGQGQCLPQGRPGDGDGVGRVLAQALPGEELHLGVDRQRDVLAVHRVGLLGDVFHGSLVVANGPRFIAHHVSMHPHPDALARLVPIDLRDEILHPPVRIQQGLELFAPVWVHIPLAREVPCGGQHLGLGFITVQADQCRIGAKLATIRAGAVGANGQQVEQR